MKSTGLKIPEKDEIYVSLGFSYYQRAITLQVSVLVFSDLNVSELSNGPPKNKAK